MEPECRGCGTRDRRDFDDLGSDNCVACAEVNQEMKEEIERESA